MPTGDTAAGPSPSARLLRLLRVGSSIALVALVTVRAFRWLRGGGGRAAPDSMPTQAVRAGIEDLRQASLAAHRESLAVQSDQVGWVLLVAHVAVVAAALLLLIVPFLASVRAHGGRVRAMARAAVAAGLAAVIGTGLLLVFRGTRAAVGMLGVESHPSFVFAGQVFDHLDRRADALAYGDNPPFGLDLQALAGEADADLLSHMVRAWDPLVPEDLGAIKAFATGLSVVGHWLPMLVLVFALVCFAWGKRALAQELCALPRQVSEQRGAMRAFAWRLVRQLGRDFWVLLLLAISLMVMSPLVALFIQLFSLVAVTALDGVVTSMLDCSRAAAEPLYVPALATLGFLFVYGCGAMLAWVVAAIWGGKFAMRLRFGRGRLGGRGGMRTLSLHCVWLLILPNYVLGALVWLVAAVAAAPHEHTNPAACQALGVLRVVVFTLGSAVGFWWFGGVASLCRLVRRPRAKGVPESGDGGGADGVADPDAGAAGGDVLPAGHG